MGIDDVRARIAGIQARFPSSGPGPAGRASASGRLGVGGPGGPVGANGAGDAAAMLAGGFGAAGGPADFASVLQRYQSGGGSTGTLATGLDSGAPVFSGNTATGNGRLDEFLRLTTAQRGDAYVWGSETTLDQTNPDSFDCSELVQWAAGRVGVTVPDGSWFQYLDLKAKGMTIPVEQALRTPGALLFSFGSEPVPGGPRPDGAHVAISLGDGRTIEARGRKWGVGTWDAGNRFEYAAVIPGLEPGR